MTKPTDEAAVEGTADEKPKLDKETLEDLDASDDQGQGVKGGETTGARNQECENATA
jgi:hypothetical protein